MISTQPRPLAIIAGSHPTLKLQRLPGGKAMTIAAGVSCRDGIVLCADQQIGTDQYKYYEKKLFITNLANGCAAM